MANWPECAGKGRVSDAVAVRADGNASTSLNRIMRGIISRRIGALTPRESIGERDNDDFT